MINFYFCFNKPLHANNLSEQENPSYRALPICTMHSAKRTRDCTTEWKLEKCYAFVIWWGRKTVSKFNVNWYIIQFANDDFCMSLLLMTPVLKVEEIPGTSLKGFGYESVFCLWREHFGMNPWLDWSLCGWQRHLPYSLLHLTVCSALPVILLQEIWCQKAQWNVTVRFSLYPRVPCP